MKPTKEMIARELKLLRSQVEKSDDLIQARVAYEIEHAIRWIILDTQGWQHPSDGTKAAADLIRQDQQPKEGT